MIEPEEIELLFAKAREYHSSEDFIGAEKIYRQLLAHCPPSPQLYSHLAMLYYETECFDRGLEMYEKAFKLAPLDLDIYFNYALCQKKCGLLDEAIVSFSDLVEKLEQDPEPLYNLANCYREISRFELAAQFYEKTLTLDSTHFSAVKNLAYVYHRLGNFEKAADLYRRILSVEPENSQAAHMLDSICEKDVKEISSQYVTEIFDEYSDTFEKNLIDDLQYSVPDQLRAAFDKLGYPKMHFSACLDLGCGTGLAGLAFAGLCDHLSGIDLSAKMIEQARKKEIYDFLGVCDIKNFLQSGDYCFDLIIAADVLTYLGDLQPVMEALPGVAAKPALFCFSTENSEKQGFHLGKTGRFLHSREYVLRQAREYGWKPIKCFGSPLRKEGDNWVNGTLYFMTCN
jgi:predicted TPR repeat methyltransferase